MKKLLLWVAIVVALIGVNKFGGFVPQTAAIIVVVVTVGMTATLRHYRHTWFGPIVIGLACGMVTFLVLAVGNFFPATAKTGGAPIPKTKPYTINLEGGTHIPVNIPVDQATRFTAAVKKAMADSTRDLRPFVPFVLAMRIVSVDSAGSTSQAAATASVAKADSTARDKSHKPPAVPLYERTLFVVLAVVAVVILLAWIFWPRKKPAPTMAKAPAPSDWLGKIYAIGDRKKWSTYTHKILNNRYGWVWGYALYAAVMTTGIIWLFHSQIVWLILMFALLVALRVGWGFLFRWHKKPTWAFATLLITGGFFTWFPPTIFLMIYFFFGR